MRRRAVTLLNGSAGRQCLFVFALALGLRLILITAWHTDDLHKFESGDYPLYAIGADHFAQEADFDNSLFLVRPPLFPVLIFLLGRHDFTVLLVNAVAGALIAPLTVVLARRLGLSAAGALIAGGMIALDPGSVVYSSFLGPEPLANLFLLVAVVAFLYGTGASGPRPAVGWAAAAAITLLLSAYCRPATYLLWIGLTLWWLIARSSHRVAVVVFVVINVAGVGAWIVHNGTVFKHYTFSTVGPYAMLYYHAASVEHLASGNDMDTVYTTLNRRVEERLGHPTAGVDADRRDHYLAASPEVASALNAVALDIFVRHPLITLLTFPIGFARMYGLVTVALNDAPIWIKVLEIAWNAAFLAAAAYGLWLAVRDKKWTLVGCVLLVGGYFTVGTLIVKSAGMTTRERSMLGPFMAVSAVYAILALWARRNQSEPGSRLTRPTHAANVPPGS